MKKTALLFLFARVVVAGATPGGISNCSFWGEATDTVLSVSHGLSLFCVQNTDSVRESVSWTAKTGKGNIVMTNNRTVDLNGCSYINFNNKTNQSAQINSYYRKQFDGDSVAINFTNVSDSIPVKQNGRNREVMFFNRVLRPSERLRVETYLAVKHDITLDNSYYSSNMGVVWDRDLLNRYSNCITGIARDDSSSLRKDSANNSVLTFKCISQITDGQYLLVGSDAGASRFESDGIDSCVLGKKWAVQVTGDNVVTSITANINKFSQIMADSILKTLILDVDGTRYQADESGNFDNVELKSGTNMLKLVSTDMRLVKRDDQASVFVKMQVSPNPTTDGNIRLQIEMSESISVRFSLLDMTGSLIGRNESMEEDYHDIIVNLPHTGVFNLRIETNKESKTIQLIRK